MANLAGSTSGVDTDAVSHQTSHSNTTPLVIVTILFFMWGLLTSLNDVLIPHLKAIYTLSYVQAMLVQFCFFGAYFIISWPAGMLIKRIGYQRGAVTGLVIAASGCALFYPASTSGYAVFLLAFFVLASGITILQVAANPYVTVLGDAKTASSRLTLTQAFNSLGTTIAPALGGLLIEAFCSETGQWNLDGTCCTACKFLHQASHIQARSTVVATFHRQIYFTLRRLRDFNNKLENAVFHYTDRHHG